MASGRNQVDYTGIGYRAITYKIDNSTILYDKTQPNGSAQVNKAVMLSGDDTVALTNDGAAVEGKLLKVESDNMATVQVEGFMPLGKGDSSSATATRGKRIVGATLSSARGYIRDAQSGTVAELEKARGRVINVADAAAIVVSL